MQIAINTGKDATEKTMELFVFDSGSLNSLLEAFCEERWNEIFNGISGLFLAKRRLNLAKRQVS